jgi:hypothetical protein
VFRTQACRRCARRGHMMAKAYLTLAAVLLVAISTFGQSPSQWVQFRKDDPLRGASFQEFTLTGKFVTPPSHGSSTHPALVVHCTPGSYAHGKARGKFVDGYISVGAVLNSEVGKDGEYVPVQIRLDDRKLQQDFWSPSTNRMGVYLNALYCRGCAFNNLLYGHMLPHKEGTSDQIHKVLIGVNEYLAAEIVMEFDMPDATQVGDACGVIWHK